MQNLEKNCTKLQNKLQKDLQVFNPPPLLLNLCYCMNRIVHFEMGCDVAKTTWTGDVDSFKQVTSAAPIPMLVAGGANTGDTRSVLLMVENAMGAGAAGVCMGRQVFAHKYPGKMARALRRIIHEGIPSSVAADEFNL